MTLKGRAHLPFSAADSFAFETAQVRQDTRSHPETGEPYPEPRYQGVGKIGRYTVMLVYTPKPAPIGFRVISLRPASKEERASWLAAQSKIPTKPPR